MSPSDYNGNPESAQISDQPIIPHARPWAEKNGFPGWVMGLGWSVSSFLLFQVVASLAAIGLLFALGRSTVENFTAEILNQNLDVLFISNSVGQILFLGLFTWIVTTLSTRKTDRINFLRLAAPIELRKNIFYGFLIVLAAQPLIMVLAWINLLYPFSESYLAFEQHQMKMIEDYLRSDHVLLFTLFHVAVVPSICEEVLFRGYLLRNFEKSMTPLLAILASGLLFGLYHVRLTQLIPLAVLGMLLAWLTIKTRSIWPAIAAHFANNGSAVLFATFFPGLAFDAASQGSLPPWYFLVLSIIFTGVLLYLIVMTNSTQRTQETYVQ
jgi:uncharacterized protein